MDGNFPHSQLEQFIKSESKKEPTNNISSTETAELSYIDNTTNNESNSITDISVVNSSLHLRFNRPLDDVSIENLNTGKLTNKKVNFSYDKNDNSISINPSKGFDKDKFYRIKVSGRVKSKNGKSLRKRVNIVFKHDGKKYYKMSNVKSFNKIKDKHKRNYPRKLSYNYFMNEAYIFAISAIALIYSSLMKDIIGLIIGSIMLVLAVLITAASSVTDMGKSKRLYLIGVKKYNSKDYYDSITYFEKALDFDKDNRNALIALDAAVEKYMESLESY